MIPHFFVADFISSVVVIHGACCTLVFFIGLRFSFSVWRLDGTLDLPGSNHLML